MSGTSISAKQLAELLGSSTSSEAILTRVSGIESATQDAVVFAETDEAMQTALASTAGLILADELAPSADKRVLRVRDPKYAFAVCAKALLLPPTDDLIHPRASIHETATVGARTRVGAGAVIEANVVVGEDCVIGSNTTLCHGITLGNRVVIQAGAVLGSTGFGYVRNRETGEYLMFPQQGGLVIEDDVEIGANTTIDRGALGETRIGHGTKIDNLVHIGHNCSVGRNVVIAAQVGISGSCVIEDGAVLAGQVGLGDHCGVGPGVIMGGQSGIYPGKTVRGPGELFAGTPAQPVREHLKSLARLRRLK